MNGEPDDEAVGYVSLDDALEIYAAIFDLSFEQAADHLRSRDALAGALARPASYAHYQQADLALQAACSRTESRRQTARLVENPPRIEQRAAEA